MPATVTTSPIVLTVRIVAGPWPECSKWRGEVRDQNGLLVYCVNGGPQPWSEVRRIATSVALLHIQDRGGRAILPPASDDPEGKARRK